MTPDRYIKIDGYDLFVIDGLFQPEVVARIANDLRSVAYNSRNSSSPSSQQYREWASQFSVEQFNDHPVQQAARSALTTFYPETSIEFWDVHCNNTVFGDWAFAHRDSNEKGAFSTLYYANDVWESDWHGETVFCQAGEPIVSISVYPGRLVLFDSRIQHRAGVPAMNCRAQRLTLSLRYQVDGATSCSLGLLAAKV